MTRKRQRLVMVVGGLVALAIAVGLVLFAFEDNLVFFYSPSEVKEKAIPADRRFRVGGLVEAGSVKRNGLVTVFRVTDTANTITIRHEGVLPDLFREGQGVVAEGAINAEGVFIASDVLAKHDENYMPPEVADAIKRAGQWRGEDGQ